jgi:hypothetical protein
MGTMLKFYCKQSHGKPQRLWIVERDCSVNHVVAWQRVGVEVKKRKKCRE